MSKSRPTYQELETRLAAAEPIVEALQHHQVDAVVGEEKITSSSAKSVSGSGIVMPGFARCSSFPASA